MSRKLIVVNAPPYGGKTSTMRILKSHGVCCMDMSDLIRERASSDREFALMAKQLMGERELLPNEVICPMVQGFMSKAKPSRVVFFGFPRSVKQTEWILPAFAGYRRHVIDVSVSYEELKRRFDERRKKENRIDDTPENFQKSIHAFNTERHQILERFNAHPDWSVRCLNGDSPSASEYIAQKLLECLRGKTSAVTVKQQVVA